VVLVFVEVLALAVVLVRDAGLVVFRLDVLLALEEVLAFGEDFDFAVAICQLHEGVSDIVTSDGR
jgi:hypothetical protein